MKIIYALLLFMILNLGCKTNKNTSLVLQESQEFTIAFGSCNKHDSENILWDDVVEVNPNVWVWGGDIIYADTDDMKLLDSIYTLQNNVKGYKELKRSVPVIGTWDDHDYGLNDGGVEFSAKKESQQKFLDFLDVDTTDQRRTREGVYASHSYKIGAGKVRIIVLDTRYFRTSLTPDTLTKKRNKPNVYGEGTILGKKQWNWLTDQLNHSDADFNIIVSSVQFLSDRHGFECWGNFPHEVDRLEQTIVQSKAKGVMILSGDRHISEISKSAVNGMPYPLIDFTSSGLTHVYSDFSGEENPYRIGRVVFEKSFGVVKLNLSTKNAQFMMMGDHGKVLEMVQQSY